LTAQQNKSRYSDHLPAIYQEDALMLEFLQPFEDVLQGFSGLLSDIDRYFSPAYTDSDFLAWLANWVALLLDEEWDEVKRRALIAEAVQLYRLRGTVGGLKRYLEIYTGYEPQIREWRWPGGMRIGVASQIGMAAGNQGYPVRIPIPEDDTDPGGDTYATTIKNFTAQRQSLDYYIVTEYQAGQPYKQIYYRVDQVKQVIRGEEQGEQFVTIVKKGSTDDGAEIDHRPATVSRRDGLIDSLYNLHLEVDTPQGTQTIDYPYQGNTLLVDEIGNQPYRFIVDVRVPSTKVVDKDELHKIRGIIDLEKPAHTMYYLKITPVVSIYELKAMQIEISERCEIGVHSFIG
jgi:phage tail-like protein